jgi:transcriptional regulator with XRE-family HTH domain
MTFFDRFKDQIHRKGTTIEYVVGKAGLTRSAYNTLRRLGNLPRADALVVMAKELDTTVEFLVTGLSSSTWGSNPRIAHLVELASGLDDEGLRAAEEFLEFQRQKSIERATTHARQEDA